MDIKEFNKLLIDKNVGSSNSKLIELTGLTKGTVQSLKYGQCDNPTIKTVAAIITGLKLNSLEIRRVFPELSPVVTDIMLDGIKRGRREEALGV